MYTGAVLLVVFLLVFGAECRQVKTLTAEAKPEANLMVNGERELEAAQDLGRCGAEGGGRICPYGSCCSSSSYCFYGDPWCGAGCQPNYGKCIERCGESFGKQCPLGYCCSAAGYCGYGDATCGDSCQLGYGRCNKEPEKMDEHHQKSARVTGDQTQNADDDFESEEKRPGLYHQKQEALEILQDSN